MDQILKDPKKTFFLHSILIFLFLMLLLTNPILSVGGISGSKLVVPAADPLDVGQTEFELGGGSYRASAEFNEYGHLKDTRRQDPDIPKWAWQREVYTENDIGFHFIAGLFPKFEAGFRMGFTISENNIGYLRNDQDASPKEIAYGDAELGMKYLINNPDDPLRFALQAGFAMNSANWSPSYDAGLIMTWDITENLSLDVSTTAFTTSSHLREGNETYNERGVTANIGIGYMIGGFQPIVEVGMSEQYSKRLRNYRYPHFVYRDWDVETSEELDSISLLGLDAYLPPDPLFPSNWQPIQEKVKVWERVYTVYSGFNYQINDTVLLTFVASQDFAGVNSAAGRSVTLVFALAFGDGGNAATAPSSEVKQEVKKPKVKKPKEKAKKEKRDDRQENAAAEEAGSRVYTIKRGDTWWKIAEKQLGDGNRFYEIKKLNPGVGELSRGTQIKLPDK